MSLRFGCARAVSAVSTWGLKNVFRRPAANFPGKIALYVDPRVIAHSRSRLSSGSICVVGTNGKTTVTNLLADAFEVSGATVVCNRTGANLDSGVATSLLHSKGADWGVFECDELWLARILPQLQSDYVVLLNLFRDQLDRVGEIDRIQESIAGALAQSPNTVLIFNADDPLCQSIANRVSNPKVPFGVDEDMKIAQNTVADASMCQECECMLEYDWRQYGQLGSYRCPHCGFTRTTPCFSATEVDVSADGVSFAFGCDDAHARVSSPLTGAYLVYNLLAVCTVGVLSGISLASLQKAIDAFDPRNGRLQSYEIGGRPVLLNLAKNPTGFNQNLKIVAQGTGRKAVGFFVNDKEADGRDLSWLWDIDFQELAREKDLLAFAGGIRKNDVQVRLKYAGVDAMLVDSASDMLAHVAANAPDAHAYVIANYTALPSVKAELDSLEETGDVRLAQPVVDAKTSTATVEAAVEVADDAPKLVIAHMFPTLLNLYGDGGNVIVLEQRARKRGFDVDVVRVEKGDEIDLASADIVFIGGGPDREQHMASKELEKLADQLCAYVEDDGVLLVICGGFQIIGRTWLLGEEIVPGLGLVDITTERADGGSRNRLVGNVALESPLASRPVVGYENHAGRTYLGENVQPFGRVIGKRGKGNNDTDGADGVLYRNVVGTYLHGPLLAKNPEIADALIERALKRQAAHSGTKPYALMALDDSVEIAANDYMCTRLGVSL